MGTGALAPVPTFAQGGLGLGTNVCGADTQPFTNTVPEQDHDIRIVTGASHCASIRILTTMVVYAEMRHDNVEHVLSKFQRRGFDCMCGNVRMAARSVTSVYDEHLKPSGLRSTQLAVLWAVVALGNGTVGRIAKTIAMDNSTLTRTLKLLERDKMISLRVGNDRREKQVHATGRGRRAFSSAMPLWQDAQAAILKRLRGKRLVDVNTLLLNFSSADRA